MQTLKSTRGTGLGSAPALCRPAGRVVPFICSSKNGRSRSALVRATPSHAQASSSPEPTTNSVSELLARSVVQAASSKSSEGVALGLLGLGLVSMTLGGPEAAMAQEAASSSGAAAAASLAAMPQFDLAEGQEFWGNVARYGRYFITVMLGTGYVMLRPIAGAFKNPLSAILAIAAVAGSVIGVKITLEAMLGVANEPFQYVQGQF